MSRYAWRKNFEFNGDEKEKEILVGWDNPMRTFFSEIFRLDLDEDSEEERSVFWIGANYDEYFEISDFVKACPFDVPSALIKRLELDRQGKFDEAAAIKLPDYIRLD